MGKLKRILFRDQSLIDEYAKTNNKVCMVVWNTFVTDARVTKEATSLIKGGKDVTVIAVFDPKKTKKKEKKNGINIIRIDRTIKKKPERLESHSTSKNVTVQQASSKNPKQANKVGLKRRVKNKLKSMQKSMLKKIYPYIPKTVINIRFFFHALRQDAGVYHAHDLNTLVPVYLVSRLKGAKLIYDAHEVSTDRAGWKNKRMWEFIEKRLAKKADEVITTNETRGDYFVKQYGIDEPWIIRNVPPFQQVQNSNLIRETFDIDNHTPIILYQGGIQRERGIENMIRCIPKVKEGIFVFIGDGALKPQIINMVEEEGLHSRVRFLNAVPNEVLLNYTASATIGLQLLQNTCFNHYSACSNKLHEYLMAGIPMVASDLPEMRKVVELTETGLLVDPDNLDEIAASINKLLEDKELYTKCKENTKKAGEMFHWGHEEEKLLKLYKI